MSKHLISGLTFRLALVAACLNLPCLNALAASLPQDSLPPLHSLKSADIASVGSSFEDQTITVIFKNGTVHVYNRADWDYENYYPSTDPRIGKAIHGITMTWTKTEQAPDFAGGPDAWNRYIQDYCREHSKEVKKSGTGDVLVSFVVHLKGQVTDFNIISNTGDRKLALLAEQAIQNSPPWIPAVQNGRKVICRMSQHVVFQ